MAELLVVLSTVPDEPTGLEIARHLVEAHLAACAQVLPRMISIYPWQGELHTDNEHLLILKVAPDRLAQLQETLAQLHPYEVPEIVAIEAYHVNPPYLHWVLSQVDPARENPFS